MTVDLKPREGNVLSINSQKIEICNADGANFGNGSPVGNFARNKFPIKSRKILPTRIPDFST